MSTENTNKRSLEGKSHLDLFRNQISFGFLGAYRFYVLELFFLFGDLGKLVTLIAWLIMILPSLLLFYGGLRSLWYMYLFRSTGVLAEGIVIDRFHGKRQSPDFDPGDFLIFQFQTSDHLVTLRAEVQPAMYKEFNLDESLQIYYATSNPRVALIEGEW